MNCSLVYVFQPFVVEVSYVWKGLVPVCRWSVTPYLRLEFSIVERRDNVRSQ